jgi:hypothetical protein
LTQDDVDKIKKEGHAGMVGDFAKEIQRARWCPPRRFVPG